MSKRDLPSFALVDHPDRANQEGMRFVPLNDGTVEIESWSACDGDAESGPRCRVWTEIVEASEARVRWSEARRDGWKRVA